MSISRTFLQSRLWPCSGQAISESVERAGRLRAGAQTASPGGAIRAQRPNSPLAESSW